MLRRSNTTRPWVVLWLCFLLIGWLHRILIHVASTKHSGLPPQYWQPMKSEGSDYLSAMSGLVFEMESFMTTGQTMAITRSTGVTPPPIQPPCETVQVETTRGICSAECRILRSDFPCRLNSVDDRLVASHCVKGFAMSSKRLLQASRGATGCNQLATSFMRNDCCRCRETNDVGMYAQVLFILTLRNRSKRRTDSNCPN